MPVSSHLTACACSIQFFLTAWMPAGKRPPLTSNAPKAPAPTTKRIATSRPTTRSVKKANEQAAAYTEGSKTHQNTHNDELQEDPDDEPEDRNAKGKSRAGTKKRPRNQAASESEQEEGHKRRSTRMKTVRMENGDYAEDERTEEIVKVGPPKGKSSISFRDLVSLYRSHHLHTALPSRSLSLILPSRSLAALPSRSRSLVLPPRSLPLLPRTLTLPPRTLVLSPRTLALSPRTLALSPRALALPGTTNIYCPQRTLQR